MQCVFQHIHVTKIYGYLCCDPEGVFFLLKDGPASKFANDIYTSSVNNQGAESGGCLFSWCCSHYINDLLTRQHSGKETNETATKDK